MDIMEKRERIQSTGDFETTRGKSKIHTLSLPFPTQSGYITDELDISSTHLPLKDHYVEGCQSCSHVAMDDNP